VDDGPSVNPSRRYTAHVYEGELEMFFRTIEQVTFDEDGRAALLLEGMQVGRSYRFKVMLVSEGSVRPSWLSEYSQAAVVSACDAQTQHNRSGTDT
jgi:hypothetical protein